MFKRTNHPLEISATIAKGKPKTAIPILLTNKVATIMLCEAFIMRELIMILSVVPLRSSPNNSKVHNQIAVIISSHLKDSGISISPLLEFWNELFIDYI